VAHSPIMTPQLKELQLSSQKRETQRTDFENANQQKKRGSLLKVPHTDTPSHVSYPGPPFNQNDHGRS